jgi:hypothetical protein
MCRLEKTDLPDNNYQVGSTNITYAPVQALRPTFLVEDTQDMKKYPQTLEADLSADSAKLAVSENLSPDALHSPIQGEEPDKNLSQAISKNKLTKVRHLQKLAAIITILSGLVGAANHSVQFCQNLYVLKNSSAPPALHDNLK